MNRPTIPHIIGAALLALYVIGTPLLALATSSWTPVWLGFCLYLGIILVGGVVNMIHERRRPPSLGEAIVANVFARGRLNLVSTEELKAELARRETPSVVDPDA